MNAPLSDHDLEVALREMLRRRALDVDPRAPAWRELAQRTDAVVISLRTGAPVDPATERRRRGPGRQWFRPVLAAAVALVVAMVGALVVGGSGHGHGDTADGPEPIDVPSAGQKDFDPAQATPLFPVTDDASTAIAQFDYLSDPTATAEQYLGSVGLPVGKDWMVVDDATRQSSISSEGEPPVQTATVPWSLHAEGRPETPPLSQGGVFLRNTEQAGRNTWLVVGVFTKTLWVTDIRRDGDELSFTVDRTTETETWQSDPATVTVDRDVVASVGYREAQPVTVTWPAGLVATIRVQHMVDGVPWSITSTAVPALAGGSTELPKDRAPVPTTLLPGDERGVDIEVRNAPAAGTPPTVPALPGQVVVEPANPTDPVEARRIAVSGR